MKDDNEVLRRIAEGDEKAFEIFYSTYSEKVYNTALSYTKVMEDAEEITQDVFVRIFKSASKFKQQSSVNTWVYRITINTSINYIKKKNRLRIFNSSEKPTDSIEFNHPGVLLEKKEEAALLFAVIDCLPTNQKTAFILSYIEDLPRREVAEIMKTSVKAVESLLQRAKKNMRVELNNFQSNRRNSKN